MPSQDIETEVKAWVSSEISRQCLGEAFGYAVTFGPAMVPTPAGQRQVPVWMLMLTTHNPALGEGPLFHGPVPVGSPRPAEADVRAAVADGIRQLRDLAGTKLAGANGHAEARA